MRRSTAHHLKPTQSLWKKLQACGVWEGQAQELLPLLLDRWDKHTLATCNRAKP